MDALSVDTWYAHYGPNTLGRNLHFLRNILDSPIMNDNVTIGIVEIYYGEPNVIAEYEFDEDGNPIYKFFGERAEEWERNQRERKKEIIAAIDHIKK